MYNMMAIVNTSYIAKLLREKILRALIAGEISFFALLFIIST